MKLFKNEVIYDATKGEFIETFWINGDTVDADTYFFFLDKEKEIEDKKLEEIKEDDLAENNCDCVCDGDCDDCCDECFAECVKECDEEFEEYCDCDECKERRFYQLIADTLNDIKDADGCPDCTMRAFMNFIMEFQDMGVRIGKR